MVGRLQVLLGPDAVTVAEYRGGLGPAERLRLVPAAAVDLGEERPAAVGSFVDEPWPGQVPAPSPARVHPDPVPIDLVDEWGRTIGVDARGEASAPPVTLAPTPGSGAGVRPRRVIGWTGPWPAEQRWWDPLTRRRRARLQVVLDDGTAHLLAIEAGAWSIEATYE